MSEFRAVWQGMQTVLKPGTEIKNWTAFHSYLGDTMTVVDVREKSISVDTPKAKDIQVVPKEDFERVWEVWSDYKAQKVKRYELRDMTFYSKYIISILHWYETVI